MFTFFQDEVKDVGLPERTDIVVNVSGENILNRGRRWSERLRDDIFNSRLQTTAMLVAAAAEQKPSVYLGISGISAYRETSATVHDEDSRDMGDHLWAQLCLQLEQTALQGLKSTRCVVFRSGVVLGREGGMIRELMLPFKLGLGARLGSGEQPLPFIHVRDLANLFLFCAQNEKARGIVNAVAPQRATNGQFTRAFARALHRPALLSIPDSVIKLMYGAERAQLVLKAPLVHPRRALDLGFQFTCPDIESACSLLVSA